MERHRVAGRIAVVGLAVSSLMLLLAPRLMPASYSWIAHTTSESAAQGVPGAWMARGGLLVFGASVVAVAFLARFRWRPWAVGLHAAFGALMIAAGVFSARPWDRELPFSQLEDLLHSVAATAMGFAFALGVAVVALERWQRSRTWRAIDLIAVTASVVLPLAMVGVEGFAGVFQRIMFVIAYVWYAREASASPGPEADGGAG